MLIWRLWHCQTFGWLVILGDSRTSKRPPERNWHSATVLAPDGSLSRRRKLISKRTLYWSSSLIDFSSRTYQGPRKSNPVWANGGSRDTRSIGKSGVGGGLYGTPSTFSQVTHFLKIPLTASRSLGIQNLSRMAVKVSLRPLYLGMYILDNEIRCLEGSTGLGFCFLLIEGHCLLNPCISLIVQEQTLLCNIDWRKCSSLTLQKIKLFGKRSFLFNPNPKLLGLIHFFCVKFLSLPSGYLASFTVRCTLLNIAYDSQDVGCDTK